MFQRRRNRGSSQDASQSIALQARGQQGYRPSVSSDNGEPMELNGDMPFPSSPPLLMPPPTRRGRLDRYLHVILYYTMAFMTHNYEFLSYLTRFGLMAGKLATLARPCWPYMPTLQVSGPLLCVAALDFGLPVASPTTRPIDMTEPKFHRWLRGVRGPGTSLLLLVLHLMVIWMAGRFEALCMGMSADGWPHWEPRKTHEYL